jgi:Protein of unknown function (DUF3088)
MKDQLFMLRAGFRVNEAGPFYCSAALPIEGLLGFFPELRRLVDVHYLEHPRPRKLLVEILGADFQGTPVLVLGEGSVPGAQELTPERANGRVFFSDPAAIRRYLCAQYGLPGPS